MMMRDLRFKLRRFLGRQDCDANEITNPTQMGLERRNEEGMRRLWSLPGGRLKLPALFSALVVAITMLAAPTQAHIGVVVGVAPPAPIVEPVPAPPVAGYVWRPGYWRWNGVRYVWLPGGYVAPPYAGAFWVTGHWGPRGAGWVWIPGHWRR